MMPSAQTTIRRQRSGRPTAEGTIRHKNKMLKIAFTRLPDLMNVLIPMTSRQLDETIVIIDYMKKLRILMNKPTSKTYKHLCKAKSCLRALGVESLPDVDEESEMPLYEYDSDFDPLPDGYSPRGAHAGLDPASSITGESEDTDISSGQFIVREGPAASGGGSVRSYASSVFSSEESTLSQAMAEAVLSDSMAIVPLR